MMHLGEFYISGPAQIGFCHPANITAIRHVNVNVLVQRLSFTFCGPELDGGRVGSRFLLV
jgi:hypothetical protein